MRVRGYRERHKAFRALLGRNVIDAHLQDRGETLVVETTDGYFTFVARGDCCATAYIDEATFEWAPGEVMSVENSDGDSVEQGGEFIDTEFWRIATADSWWSITLYTEHNGYYSGWIELDRIDLKEAQCD